MYKVILKQGKENKVFSRVWVYANEVERIEGKDKQGSVAEVVSHDGRLVGYGFINHLSKIIVRFLSKKEETFDENFFRSLLIKSIERRDFDVNSGVRLVFGESDNLPGLIVDKYGEYLSVQFLTLGMDLLRDLVVNTLVERLSPKGVYERSDVPIREKEGLRQKKGLLYGEVPDEITFVENGLTMAISVKEGQKTGYFLDQKRNRERFAHYASGKTVLDCFSNVGGFALNAAKGGAKEVTALDVSPLAVQSILRNAELNGLKINAYKADVFEELRAYKKEGRKFDLICLDPPAFTKSADTVDKAYSGYRDVNILALKLLSEGGVLFTCSCSQHMTIDLFLKMLKESAINAKADVSLLELSIQNVDHACKITEDEALYLKVAVVRRN
ncbi:MAG: class I SAM-dependent rRNA methyltransferase [Clostridia bacterium]|nr:class I SAM-dependent rRNA methyltransferase [Clostridia bacterium]